VIEPRWNNDNAFWNKADIPHRVSNVRFRRKADIGRTLLPATDPRLNAAFTMLAILIYGRLTEMEQTKNYLSLSR